MSLTPGFSSEEIRGYVWEYLDLPQGSKEGWLEGKPFTRAQFHRWRKAFVSGDMERGLVPRSSSSGPTLFFRTPDVAGSWSGQGFLDVLFSVLILFAARIGVGRCIRVLNVDVWGCSTARCM